MTSIQRQYDDDDESSCEVLNVARIPPQNDDEESVDSTRPPRTIFSRRRPYNSTLKPIRDSWNSWGKRSCWTDEMVREEDDERKQPASELLHNSPCTPPLQSTTISPTPLRSAALSQKSKQPKSEKLCQEVPGTLCFTTGEVDGVIRWPLRANESVQNGSDNQAAAGGNCQIQEHDTVAVTPESLRGGFRGSEGDPRNLIFDVDDNPLLSLRAELSAKGTYQTERCNPTTTIDDAEGKNHCANPNARNSAALHGGSMTLSQSSHKSVREYSGPQSDFERLYPDLVDIGTSGRRKRPRETDLFESENTKSRNNARDHSGDRRSDDQAPSTAMKKISKVQCKIAETKLQISGRTLLNLQPMYPESVDQMKGIGSEKKPATNCMVSTDEAYLDSNNEDGTKFLLRDPSRTTPAMPEVIDLVDSDEEPADAAPNLEKNLRRRRSDRIRSDESISGHEDTQVCGNEESDRKFALHESSRKAPDLSLGLPPDSACESDHDTDSDANVGTFAPCGLLEKRQSPQLREIPQKRVRRISKGQEELKRLGQRAMQQRGYYAKREVCVLVHPELGQGLSKALGRLNGFEKTTFFPIMVHDSGSDLRAVQFVRHEFMDGGAEASSVALKEGEVSNVEVTKQVVFPFDCLDDFLLLLTTENADSDSFPQLSEWVKALKYRWQRHWKQVEEPQVFVLLRCYSGRCEEEKMLIERAKSFLGVIHGVECTSCGSPGCFLKFVQRMAVCIGKAAYAKPTTHIKCLPRLRASEHLKSQEEIAHDTWYRMLRSIPSISTDRASSLLHYYPTMRSLWLAYQDKNRTEKEKQTLVVDLLDPEKHLTELSSHIYRVMTSSDPNKWIY